MTARHRAGARRNPPVWMWVTAALTATAFAAVVTVLTPAWVAGPPPPAGPTAATRVLRDAQFTDVTAATLQSLPEARFDAVIAGLMPYRSADVPAAATAAYAISSDTPLYDASQIPVARFAFTDFTGRPTVIVPVRIDGPWALVMTPARQSLPSAMHGDAPAQTVGWIRTSALHKASDLSRRVVVSVGHQSLSIQSLAGHVQQAFAVGVGAPDTPTPTGVTGYLEERFLDPGQGESVYPIVLTSLHAAAQDEPFQGEDGGLIGIHYFAQHDGAVSHGCIRLPEEAIRAMNALPLGTSITIVP